MSELKQRIEKRLREEICSKYKKDPKSDKIPQECKPLINRLDEVIDVISGIRDYSLEPYEDKIRSIICSTCREDKKGRCTARDEHKCALDNDFPKIVAILEQEFKRDSTFA
jgi:hypothetical protein